MNEITWYIRSDLGEPEINSCALRFFKGSANASTARSCRHAAERTIWVGVVHEKQKLLNALTLTNESFDLASKTTAVVNTIQSVYNLWTQLPRSHLSTLPSFSWSDVSTEQSNHNKFCRKFSWISKSQLQSLLILETGCFRDQWHQKSQFHRTDKTLKQ